MAGEILGQHVRRIPDGETGVRSNWIGWQIDVFRNSPQLEAVEVEAEGRPAATQIRIRDGSSPAEVALPDLGYSAAAIASYAEFVASKTAGNVPPECRFQVSLPTPLAPIHLYVVEGDRAALETVYEAKLLAELDEITKAIPAAELAVQWDTAVEFGVLEGVFPTYLADPEAGILERLIRLGDAVPPEVELGYHLCYGDAGHTHFVEPDDAAILTKIANGVAQRLSRPLNWVHLPVPSARTDAEYFSPLANLALAPQTELYLGLLHVTDGEEGARKRIAAAFGSVAAFGVATECGFGRRPAESIPELMRMHATLADPLGGGTHS